MNGISTLIKETPESLLTPLPCVVQLLGHVQIFVTP